MRAWGAGVRSPLLPAKSPGQPLEGRASCGLRMPAAEFVQCAGQPDVPGHVREFGAGGRLHAGGRGKPGREGGIRVAAHVWLEGRTDESDESEASLHQAQA